jgi:hypothetical protein
MSQSNSQTLKGEIWPIPNNISLIITAFDRHQALIECGNGLPCGLCGDWDPAQTGQAVGYVESKVNTPDCLSRKLRLRFEITQHPLECLLIRL